MRTRAAAFVGRTAELAALHGVLGGARRGAGAIAFVTGEAGIGKSRLLREALGYAVDAEMPVLRGRGSSTGPAVPFRPLTEAVLSVARTLDADVAAELGPYRRVLGRLVPEWADPDGRFGDVSMVVLGEAILRLTALLGRGRGCVLALDDLHEADPESIAVVEYLAGNLTGQPVAVLVTARTDSHGAYAMAEEVTRRDGGALLALDRLDADGVHDLVASCLGVDPAQVPGEVVDRLCHDSAGNPLMVEELLHSLIATGELVRVGDAWWLTGASSPAVPSTLVRLIGLRADQLGPSCSRLLSVAAVLGRRFPLTIVQRVLDLTDHTLLSDVQSAVDAQLLAPDDRMLGWYAFQHPLAVDALRRTLGPDDLAGLSGRAADAIAEVYPELPGEWCELAAQLRLNAGEPVAAARLHLESARRATAAGAVSSALAALDRACARLGDPGADAEHRRVQRELLAEQLHALAEAGQFDRALAVADELALGSSDNQIDLHLRLAWAAQGGGRWAEGDQQVRAARELADDATEEQLAELDAVAAYLAILSPDADRMDRCERLARQAIARAEPTGLTSVACQAWYAVGVASRERDLAESDACFRRALASAEEHDLTNWRNYALVGLGGNAWLAEGDGGPLRRAHRELLAAGAISLAHNAAAVLALHATLHGEFDRAATDLAECLAETRRLKLISVTRYLLMVKVVHAAHRGRREEMQAAIAEFTANGGEESSELALVHGLGRAFCALLEEDRAGARVELTRVAQEQSRKQNPFHLAGSYGLGVLLDVLDGQADQERLRQVADGNTGRMRWNRHFVALAEAVLAGRRGDDGGVADAMRRADSAAAPFPVARNLGLRLVAEAAVADGWGQPREWLLAAEDYFHEAGAGPVAGACRALLRRLGEPVRQRRSGTDRIPEELRRLGVTAREFEVLELMPGRLGNKALAARLHISPRTAEKHVASLLQKVGLPDRDALFDSAADLLAR